MSTRINSCYITAPAGRNLDTLRDALKRRGIRIVVPQDLPIGSDWLTEVAKSISGVDLVIGVLTQQRSSEWVLFELGQAWAAGKQILLFVPPSSSSFPLNLSRFLTVRANLSNRKAIEFALDQLLAAPEREVRLEVKRQPQQVLGSAADEYLRRVEQALQAHNYFELERIVAEALKQGGAEAMSTSLEGREGADLAIWSDALQHYVGNPLLVEIKARISSSTEADNVVTRLSKLVTRSGTLWGLLLYAESHPKAVFHEASAPNVLHMELPALLDRMRTESFPDIIKEMRNRRIHGAA